MNRMIRTGSTLISIEDYAFYCGAQGVLPKDGLAEIEHNFAQKKSKIEGASVAVQKPLEAVLHRNTTIRPHVEAEWKEMLDRFGNHPPPVLMAYVMGILGIVALLVDAILTGPSLDALGVSEPALQYISAFALASLSSAIFHLTVESFESKTMDWRTRWACRMLAGFAVVGLICWGILRGHQIAFGADLASNPLGGFLRGHFLLSSVVFCFITLGSPLAAAFSVGHAMPQIHQALRWQRANREHQKLTNSTANAQKALEAEQDKTTHALKDLDSERREWQSRFLQYHRRGGERGGREEPGWLVIAKTIAATLLAAAIVLPLAHFFWPICFLPLAVGVSSFVHFRRTRFTPGYRKFRRQEAPHFAVTETQQVKPALPQPRTIEATMEKR